MDFKDRYDRLRELVEEFLHEDPAELSLKLHNRGVEDAQAITRQVQGLQKAEKKLPTWYNRRCILPALAVEQSSSERAANIRFDQKGKRALDLTCGLGVDTYTLSKAFHQVIAIEPNQELAEIVRFNLQLLGADNVEVLCTTAEEYLEQNADQKFDFVFIDPDRRADGSSRSILFEDCQPNIIQLKQQILKMSDQLMIKGSPLFDIDEGLRVFPECVHRLVVSVDREMKETVFVLSNSDEKSTRVTHCIDTGEPKRISLPKGSAPELSDIEAPAYIYEPDVAFYKSRLVPEYLASQGIELNATDGYGWAANQIQNFEGKVYQVEEALPFQPKKIAKRLQELNHSRINISRKSFRHSAESIRKQLKIKEGGEVFLLFTTNQDGGEIAMIARRLA